MAVVRSYIAGHWFAPDSGTPVCDAVTMVAKEWHG